MTYVRTKEKGEMRSLPPYPLRITINKLPLHPSINQQGCLALPWHKQVAMPLLIQPSLQPHADRHVLLDLQQLTFPLVPR